MNTKPNGSSLNLPALQSVSPANDVSQLVAIKWLIVGGGEAVDWFLVGIKNFDAQRSFAGVHVDLDSVAEKKERSPPIDATVLFQESGSYLLRSVGAADYSCGGPMNTAT